MPDTPLLHNLYSSDEAIGIFAAGDRPEFCCDGQFVILPSVVLCCGTVGPNDTEPYMSSPSEFVWRPKTRATGDDWLPPQVTEVWDRSTRPMTKTKGHHIFLRNKGEESFLYCGEAHLGSYGTMQTKDGSPGRAANFSLNTKLPREEWLKLGGYSDWMIEINHQSHYVNAGDPHAFEALVQELASQPFSHLSMTRYEEDSLHLYTNASRGWLMYLREPGDSGLYTRDPNYDGADDDEERFRCVCGIDLEFPREQTLPRETAAQVCIEFFQGNCLAHCIGSKGEAG